MASTFSTSVGRDMRDLYLTGSDQANAQFQATGDGRALLAERTELVESVIRGLWREMVSPEDGPAGFCIAAIGGFGRSCLFPYSDVDLLFLVSDRAQEEALRDTIREFSQELWDMRLKLSPATRTLSECERIDSNNVEFTISLLDSRYLAGDRELFDRLRQQTLPKLVQREANSLIQRLAELSRLRHGKYGSTIFHLEPNVKDAPGGIRDYNVACWLAMISAMDKLREWPDAQKLLPEGAQRRLSSAVDFLADVRCFLHLRYGRDDNMLSWEAQEEAAKRKIGVAESEEISAADWMRIYFRHARAVQRVCAQLMEEIPAARSTLYRQFQNWRSRTSNPDFSVVDGLIFLKQASSMNDPEALLRLFDFVAHHGFQLSATTEYRIEQVLPSLAATPPQGAELWRYLQVILLEPFAADALRAMHSLRLLTLLIPELKPIDALVVRDFYHRFTVDEHSFLAIEHLHRAKDSPSEWDQRYGQLLHELEQPELLYLALLLHDVGKGVPGSDHIPASLELAAECLNRLDLEPADREVVLFLIGAHLEMSATLRRDIFDPETAQGFAEKLGTPERLKMLCLMTYADIKAVNPEALTPWKAENLWQLYMVTANYLNRSADQRLHNSDGDGWSHMQTLAPVAGKTIRGFLEGMPKRYLRTYTAEEMMLHLKMSEQLGRDAVQLDLKRGRHWFELTLVTADRPSLFAKVAGVLAAWGMNIVKANAFSNDAAMVVDSFFFTDRFRTLDLNLPEWERFQKSIKDVLGDKADLDRMLQDRMRSEQNTLPKVKVETRVELDEHSSATTTLLQIIAQDRLGLLHRISSRLAQQQCNIEIALIDTEGQMAIDVFYLTSGGKKLLPERRKELAKALLQELG